MILIKKIRRDHDIIKIEGGKGKDKREKIKAAVVGGVLRRMKEKVWGKEGGSYKR